MTSIVAFNFVETLLPKDWGWTGARLLGLLLAGVLWFAFDNQSPQMRGAAIGAAWGGLIGAVGGFVGPIVFAFGGNLGPLMGFVMAGSMGVVLGAIIGLAIAAGQPG